MKRLMIAAALSLATMNAQAATKTPPQVERVIEGCQLMATHTKGRTYTAVQSMNTGECTGTVDATAYLSTIVSDDLPKDGLK